MQASDDKGFRSSSMQNFDFTRQMLLEHFIMKVRKGKKQALSTSDYFYQVYLPAGSYSKFLYHWEFRGCEYCQCVWIDHIAKVSKFFIYIISLKLSDQKVTTFICIATVPVLWSSTNASCLRWYTIKSLNFMQYSLIEPSLHRWMVLEVMNKSGWNLNLVQLFSLFYFFNDLAYHFLQKSTKYPIFSIMIDKKIKQ